MGRDVKLFSLWTGLDALGFSALASVIAPPSTENFRATLDIIRGTRGNDALGGGSGDETFYGGNGDDWLAGGAGHDSAYGGHGNDTVFGNEGDDLVFGGLGNDLLVGDSFFDFRNPDAIDRGTDTIYGGSGDDRIYGRLDNDLLFGGAGNDLFAGGTGNDTIYGGAGNDQTRPSNGDDAVFGGAGNDTLTDGLGADDFTGGAGADSFVYLISDDIDRDEGGPTAGYGVGNDRILDFSLAQHDTVVIDLQLANRVVISDIVDDGTSTAFVLSYGEVITLTGFSGEDFAPGLRFDSVEDINALSQLLYGYDAMLAFF